uniref:Uncharacterized protein n=1 Tax=Panagrolaimus davidi TaxID=227884 RepID=A0A914Q7Q2_9BILA
MFDIHGTFNKLRRDIIKNSYYHLYLNKKWSWRFYWGSNYLKLDYFHRRVINWHMITIYERDLYYPHDQLKLCLRKFEQQTSYFVIAIYINYLKQNGQCKYLLGIYSKYCRFFLDDDEMNKEYEEAMREHGPVHLPWENLFEFEKSCDMEEAEDQYFSLEEADDTQSSDEEDSFDKSICRRFYDTYEVYQEFAVPGPIVLYVLKNAGHRVLRKLFASCKWFFAKQPTPICHRLRTGSREIYKDESLTLKRYSKKELFPKKLYITGNIFCGMQFHYESTALIDFLPKFYRCEAKFISLPSNIHLSFDELKSLIGHGGVVKLDICRCILKDEKNKCVALEKIMEFLPNIEQLGLNNVKITKETPRALTSMEFCSKFESICIYLISGEQFDAEEFSKFLIVNKSDEYFFCELTFCKEFNADFVQSFEKLMEKYCIVHQNDDSDEEENGDEFETNSNDSD